MIYLALLALFPCLALSQSTSGKYFDRVFTIIFENHAEAEVIADPNFLKYRNMGKGLLNYFAVAHPSQPNYIALIGGSTRGCTGDSNINISGASLVDLMEAKKVSWKGYMENYPGSCNTAASSGLYYRKHNPFISFDNVRNNATLCAKIVPAEPALDADLAAGTLPQYSFYTPNIQNDAHDTNITFGGKWLDSFLSTRLSKFPPRTAIIVTWDEDDYTEANQVLTFMIGDMLKAGTTDNTKYDHYSMLATIEDNWALGNLGLNDKTATLINFVNAGTVDVFNGSRPELNVW